MGACIGKKSSKYLKHDHPQSDIIQAPQPTLQDDITQNKSSPSLSKKLQMAEGFTDNNDVEYRISKCDENSIDSEVQSIIDQQNIINNVLNQPFSTGFPSITNTELEFELANLIYNSSTNDHIENPLASTSLKSDHT